MQALAVSMLIACFYVHSGPVSYVNEKFVRFIDKGLEVAVRSLGDFMPHLSSEDEVYVRGILNELNPEFNGHVKHMLQGSIEKNNFFAFGNDTLIFCTDVKSISRATLIGVLAHEMGHIMEQDAWYRTAAATSAIHLFSWAALSAPWLISGSIPSSKILICSAVILLYASAAQSRHIEHRADLFAIKTLEETLSPEDAAVACEAVACWFEKSFQHEPGIATTEALGLSSHPSIKLRKEFFFKEAARIRTKETVVALA